jgi:hypothetical protein
MVSGVFFLSGKSEEFNLENSSSSVKIEGADLLKGIEFIKIKTRYKIRVFIF